MSLVIVFPISVLVVRKSVAIMGEELNQNLSCDYCPVGEILTKPIIIVLHFASRALALFFIYFRVVVPALVYSHISCAIKRLQLKMEHNFGKMSGLKSPLNMNTGRSTKFVNEVRRCWR